MDVTATSCSRVEEKKSGMSDFRVVSFCLGVFFEFMDVVLTVTADLVVIVEGWWMHEMVYSGI